MTSPHISDDELDLLAIDRLPETVAAAGEEHLFLCAEWVRLAEWDEYVWAIRAAADP